MNKLLPYLLFVILLFASSCIPANKNSAPVAYPSGTFSGQFRRVHVAIKTGARDTLLANITLSLNTTTGFKLTGDTSTIIAGSYGNYAINASYIEIGDATYSKTTQTKVHLNGTYAYYYDGSVFQMITSSTLDTLSYQYDLKRIN